VPWRSVLATRCFPPPSRGPSRCAVAGPLDPELLLDPGPPGHGRVHMVTVDVDDDPVQHEPQEFVAKPWRLLVPTCAEIGQKRPDGGDLGRREHTPARVWPRLCQHLQAFRASINLLEDQGDMLWRAGERQVLLQGVDLLLQPAPFAPVELRILAAGVVLGLKLGEDGLGVLHELTVPQDDVSDRCIQHAGIEQGAGVIGLPVIIGVIAPVLPRSATPDS
jgi:hypothetical protein